MYETTGGIFNSYDDLDRVTEADYNVSGEGDEDEQFTYDILCNRITLNPRVGGNVVYASNTVNEYTDIGGVTPEYDDCGSLTKDINGYTYHYDNDNRVTKIKKTNDTVDVAIYTYDALGRRIEKDDAVGDDKIRYYYDGELKVSG